MKTTPKSIQGKAIQLEKALNKVAKLANELEEWAEKHGADGADFFYANRLDMPYEFDLSELLENLELLANGNAEELEY